MSWNHEREVGTFPTFVSTPKAFLEMHGMPNPQNTSNTVFTWYWNTYDVLRCPEPIGNPLGAKCRDMPRSGVSCTAVPRFICTPKRRFKRAREREGVSDGWHNVQCQYNRCYCPTLSYLRVSWNAGSPSHHGLTDTKMVGLMTWMIWATPMDWKPPFHLPSWRLLLAATSQSETHGLKVGTSTNFETPS